MRTFLRIVLRGLVALVLLFILLLAICLKPVDRSGHPGTAYATATAERLLQVRGAGTNPPAWGLRAGFGRARLTPTLGGAVERPGEGEFTALPLAGYGNRKGRAATGVHDDVWVKAVAFEAGGRTGVVVAADALIIPREIAEQALERLHERHGLDRSQVYFSASHTHCSLGGWGEGWVGEAFAGPFHPGVRIWMARQLAEAATKALGDLAPAALGRTSFAAPDLIRNRLVGDKGTIDPEFSLLVVHKDGGERAVLGSFSAHATVLSGGFMEFSAEYPGYWQRTVEAQMGGMAVFLAGGVGSHGPRAPAGGIEGARGMGERLAERTTQALADLALTQRAAWWTATLEVDLPPLQVRVTDAVALRPWLARRLLPVGTSTWIQAWRIGDSVWLSTPCDYSGEMALDLKAAARAAGLHAVVTSFNGDYVGYVVPSKYYGLDGYETRTMAFFGPQLPDYLDAALRGLLDRAGGTER